MERGGCFQQRLSVCLFVNTITSEQLNVGRWNLTVRCIVQKSCRSSNLRSKIEWQGHQGQKTKKRGILFGSGHRGGGELLRPPVLCRWENQRMLSSCRLFYHEVLRCACLSVSLSVRLHISKTICLNLTKFSVRVTCGPLTFCTSGFVDDVMSVHNGEWLRGRIVKVTHHRAARIRCLR